MNSPIVPGNSVFMSRLLLWIVLVLAALSPVSRSLAAPEGTVVIVGKNFTEQVILGEIFSILIQEHAGLKVEKKLNLGGTQVCFEALRSGEADIYPEYTGTAFTAMLEKKAVPDRDLVYDTVKRVFAEKWDLIWLEPMEFNNTYTLTVREETAKRLGLEKISDLIPHARNLIMGCTHEFIERADGLPGIKQAYGFEFGTVKALDPGLTYTAARDGVIDVCDAYATDGRIKAYNLKVLEDDRNFFPPYPVAPLVRGEVLRKYPALGKALSLLAGQISDDEMRQMNFSVDNEGQEAVIVARNFLVRKGLTKLKEARTEVSSRAGFLEYLWHKRHYVLGLAGVHLMLTGAAVFLAGLVGVPFGILLTRKPGLAPGSLMTVNVIQTIPSLALLGFLIPVMGIGARPAILALFLYALLPIVRNTFTGIRGVDPALIEAATGMGMTRRQILFLVELPLAMSVIMAGIRTSTVINIGTATLAALIGAGGLGEPIFRGIAMVNNNVILSGAIPAAVLALVADSLLGLLERWLAPAEASAVPDEAS